MWLLLASSNDLLPYFLYYCKYFMVNIHTIFYTPYFMVNIYQLLNETEDGWIQMVPNSSTFNTYNICKCHANLCSVSLSLRCYAASVYLCCTVYCGICVYFAYCICLFVCLQTKNIQYAIQRICSNMHKYTQIIDISTYLIKYIGTIFTFPNTTTLDYRINNVSGFVQWFSLSEYWPLFTCVRW